MVCMGGKQEVRERFGGKSLRIQSRVCSDRRDGCRRMNVVGTEMFIGGDVVKGVGSVV